MAIHSLPQFLSCFILPFLVFDVSFVVAPAVPIGEGTQIIAAQSTPTPAQPNPLPAADSMPAQTSASPTPPFPSSSANPTPAPIRTPRPPARASPTPARAFPPPARVSPPPARVPVDQKLLAGVASGVRSEVNGIPSSSAGCVTTECIAFYPSVNVFYWPPAAPNTACLSTVTDQPSAGPQPTPMISPSIYVVYPPATVYDLCGNTADPGMHPPTTETYAPGVLQTLQAIPGGDPVTQVFNYGDLPCPPPSIAAQLDPGAAYNPVLIAPFIFTHQIENTNSTLNCGVNGIKDPPRAVTVAPITGPGGGPPP